MNIILFGPPGVGKSTLIGVLKSEGLRAIDLEDVYPSRIRFQLPAMVDGVVFGGADLNPKRQYFNTKKVFLNLPQDVYQRRRAERDSRNSGKASQKQHQVSDWLKGVKYDVVLDASGSSRQTAQLVKNLLQEGHANEVASTTSNQ